jgi:protease secretion system membrane fusion protein
MSPDDTTGAGKSWWGRRTERRKQQREQAMQAALERGLNTDTAPPVRWGRRALWLGLGFAVLWAGFAPLGQGVPTSGVVTVEGNRKTIQHPRGGVIDEILVKEGDAVTAGQPLIRLNEAQAQAQQGSIETQLIGLMAVQSRLQAERTGQSGVEFPPFLQERRALPQAQQAMDVQRQLFATRRSALQGELAILSEQLNGLGRQLEGLAARDASTGQQIGMYGAELAALKPLFEQGFIPRQRMFELERALAYMEGQRNEDLASAARVRSQVSEVRLKMVQAREAFRKEVDTQLTDIQRQVDDLTERRVATLDELKRVVLRAPESGTIVDLTVNTVGGVAGPGQKLMDVVPQGSRLIVEVRIPTHLIDAVQPGQMADLHFPAFDQALVSRVDGRLVYVGADRQTDAKGELAFFVGRVEITPEGWQQLKGQVLRPGMPADVIVKTGERSLLAYLARPLLVRLQTGMTER